MFLVFSHLTSFDLFAQTTGDEAKLSSFPFYTYLLFFGCKYCNDHFVLKHFYILSNMYICLQFINDCDVHLDSGLNVKPPEYMEVMLHPQLPQSVL
jgi:hypothetical protein